MKLPSIRINKNIILSISLILSVIISIWATRLSVELNARGNKEDTKDAFMTDVSYVSYNKEGHWESSFHSPHMDQYNHKGIVFLQNPILDTVGEKNLTWKITAKRATSYQRTNIVELKDDVVIERTNHQNQEKTWMNTTRMTLYPQKKYLETKAPVTIKQLNSTVEAVGLKADLNTGDIRLSSDTKSVYQP
ncbi:MAG: lptC [Gammaproteobacteria bacterium]|jgi:lipopolysaccharide export system protein LptC|nr:lptC [Gammaproteobacteria bacterium]